jgi:hypothetical protein
MPHDRVSDPLEEAMPAIEGSIEIIEVRRSCSEKYSPVHDAVFFVHGIFGDTDTFRNGDFVWPKAIPENITGQHIDVYQIRYRAPLISWLKRDVESLDVIVDAIYEALQGTVPSRKEGLVNRYRSVGFITHSLGGNVIAAYLHTVKTALGHEARARHSFLIALGAPANGAYIANVGAILKGMFSMEDRLLESLKLDNTFLRMMTLWRQREQVKAENWNCRPVNLYVAVEGKPTRGTMIVPKESAADPVGAFATEVKTFEDRNHLDIAKPANETDDLYVWVDAILKKEIDRLAKWEGPLCKNPGGYNDRERSAWGT